MGERSNIFVRIRSKKRTKDKKYTYGTFFGLYYQWCYGERMISRLRSAIDFANTYLSGWSYGEYAVEPTRISMFKRFLAVNFDMRDIAEPVDIIQDAIDNVKQGYLSSKADIFDQAENHGFIYIDISLDDPDKQFGNNEPKINYAFVSNECRSTKFPDPVMSVTQFADRDIGDGERKWYEPDPYWDRDDNRKWGPEHKKEFLENVVPTCRDNIRAINGSAYVMTPEERKDFVSFGRRFARKILQQADDEKEVSLEKRDELVDAIKGMLCYGKPMTGETSSQLLDIIDKVYPKPAR